MKLPQLCVTSHPFQPKVLISDLNFKYEVQILVWKQVKDSNVLQIATYMIIPVNCSWTDSGDANVQLTSQLAGNKTANNEYCHGRPISIGSRMPARYNIKD